MPSQQLPRRSFLRAAGVAVGLPLLPSLLPRSARAATEQNDARRMIAICAPLGIHTPYLFPEKSGRDYEVTPYLEPLQGVRDQFSVMSGLMHPMVDGGHDAERSFLTGAAHPGQPSFRNTISVDQFAAERIGHQTRFPFLSLTGDGRGLSYTRSGVLVPSESKPSRVFAQLFLEGSAEEKKAQMERIENGRSVLDLVSEQTRSIGRRAGREDHRTLDEYLSSIRELEQRLDLAGDWARKPKPTVDQEPPTDITDRSEFTARMELLLDLMYLAIRTDSTRLITLKGPGGAEVVALQGVEDGWHNLSHHGKDPEKIEQLAIIEKEEMRLFGRFLERLAETKEGNHSLLDQTAILMGSNLGNASSHNNTNLPILAAGGRFRHAGHLAFDPAEAPPLANLLISFLQHLKLEVEEFSSGSGTLAGLELVG